MTDILSTDPRTPDSKLYLTQMGDIRERLDCILWLAYSEKLFKASHDYLLEAMFLHLRKVLELIAFSSLTANQAEYAAAHAQFERHWKAAKMLKALKSVNPNFYPLPVALVKVPAAGEAAQYNVVSDGYLTPEEFEFLYDVSSAVLHTPNPFQERTPLEIRRDIPEWVNRIRRLLSIHIMHFVDDRRWLVYAPENGTHQVLTVMGHGPSRPSRK